MSSLPPFVLEEKLFLPALTYEVRVNVFALACTFRDSCSSKCFSQYAKRIQSPYLKQNEIDSNIRKKCKSKYVSRLFIINVRINEFCDLLDTHAVNFYLGYLAYSSVIWIWMRKPASY